VEEAFRGSRTSGRWHSRGWQPVYAASSIALAALERLVYLRLDPVAGMVPQDHLFRIRVPAKVAITETAVADLPKDWIDLAAPPNPLSPATPLQALGDAWSAAAVAAVLTVPSALVPEEPNALLNPAHPDFAKLAIDHVRPFRYDPRLSRSRRPHG
jgi:RES domain-containing protein